MMARRLSNGWRARGSMDNQTDERDGRIIDMLRADPTVLNSRISEALGVSNATVGARIKKLKDLGIVRVVASTDIRAAGFNTVAIGSMAVAPGKPDTCDAVARELAKDPHIISIGTRLHREQIMFYAIGRDAAHIEQILSTTASAIKEIEDVLVRIVLSNYKYSINHGPLVEVQPNFERRLRELADTQLSESLGERELSVLAMLHGDGRMSLREVARRLDYPESQVRTIFRKFENTPGILNYQTVVNPRSLGHRHVHQLNFKANYHLLPSIVQQLKNMPEVLGLATLSGTMNLTASTSTPSRAALQALVNERIPMIKGITEIEVIDMLHGYKFEGSWTVPVVKTPSAAL